MSEEVQSQTPKITLGPQAGPQTMFLSCPADIVIYGGAAGGGKSVGLLLEPLRHMDNGLFRGVIFRRESPQITNPGGLWDESATVYGVCGARPLRTTLEWIFPSRMKMKFAHMQLEDDKFAWQGAQIAYLGFDEVTHFTESQFFYLTSRLRGVSGVPGYVRATCNPDPDSWVAKFISWWIDQDTGLPIMSRAGKLRYFVREGNEMIWASSRKELEVKYPLQAAAAKSVTFIPSSIDDNKILLAKDPGYIANLNSLPLVDRARLLGGNWKIRPSAGLVFKKSWFQKISKDQLPHKRRRVRYWDRAATEQNGSNNPDWTVGVLMSRDDAGIYYIEGVTRLQGSPSQVETTIKNIASQDSKEVTIGIEEDPGQAGKFESSYYVKVLAGYTVKLNPAREDKVTRAGPLSSQCEFGKVKVVDGPWNDVYLDELEAFPTKGAKDDQVDASSGAFKLLTNNIADSFGEDAAKAGSKSSSMEW